MRRTAASGIVGLGFQPHIIECVLNHVSGAQGGLVAVYQRYEYLEERKRAIEAWGIALKAWQDRIRHSNITKYGAPLAWRHLRMKRFLKALGVLVAGMTIIVAAISTVQHWFPYYAHWFLLLYIPLYFIAAFVIVGVTLWPNHFLPIVQEDVRNKFKRMRAGEDADPWESIIVLPLLCLASFLGICYTLSMAWPGKFFVGSTGNPLSWPMYLVDQVGKVVFFDFFEIFRLPLSGIEHANDLLACTLVFSFRTTLSVGLIGTIVTYWRVMREIESEKQAPSPS